DHRVPAWLEDLLIRQEDMRFIFNYEDGFLHCRSLPCTALTRQGCGSGWVSPVVRTCEPQGPSAYLNTVIGVEETLLPKVSVATAYRECGPGSRLLVCQFTPFAVSAQGLPVQVTVPIRMPSA